MSIDTSEEFEHRSEHEVYNALKNLRRRYALYYLKQCEASVPLGQLAEQIAAWENNTTVENVTAEQRKSVYSALHQTHIPKLVDAGVISYDRNNGCIEFSTWGKQLDLYLGNDLQTSIRWNRFYLGVSLVGTVGLLLSSWGAPLFAAVPELGWATTLFLVFTVAALVHTYDLQQWRRRFEENAPDFAIEFNRN